MSIELERISWLFIGSGMGITIGRDNVWILIFGIGLITLGFIINYINNIKWKK